MVAREHRYVMMVTRVCACFIALILASCAAPVLRSDLAREASPNVPFPDMVAHPENYKGRLFALGGILASTRLMERGALLEAVYVPVDSNGQFLAVGAAAGRFLALYPKEQGLLDPLIFTKGRRVTVAAVFVDVSPGKIDTVDYTFPFFEIKDIYLWPEITEIRFVPYPMYPQPLWPYSPWPYRPWGPYYGPWW